MCFCSNVYGDNGTNSGKVSATQVGKVMVYAAGYRTDHSNIDHAGYWENGKWTRLAPHAGRINSIVVRNGKLFAAGSSFSQRGSGGIWTDGRWTTLTSSVSVKSIAVAQSTTFAAGTIIDAHLSVPIVAGYWKNGIWHGIVPSLFANVTSMAVSGPDVYLGGKAGSDTFYLHAGFWKNGKWVALPSLEKSGESEVTCLVVRKGDVHAGGYSYNDTGMVPGYWRNGTWVELPRPNSLGNGSVNALAVLANNVFAGGYRTEPSGVITPACWENGKWVGLSLPQGSRIGEVLSIAVTRG